MLQIGGASGRAAAGLRPASPAPCRGADGPESRAMKSPQNRSVAGEDAADRLPRAPAGGALRADPGELAEVLCEFEAVIEDFASPVNARRAHYEEHLARMKRRSSASVSDSSGISDSESADSLYRNSFSFSDEKLNSPTMSSPTSTLPSPAVTPCKARLGDTKELEDFIADLDRTLASM